MTSNEYQTISSRYMERSTTELRNANYYLDQFESVLYNKSMTLCEKYHRLARKYHRLSINSRKEVI